MRTRDDIRRRFLQALGAGMASRAALLTACIDKWHLGRDLAESTNEYDRHPEIVKSLSNLLEQYKQTGRSAPKDRLKAAEI